MKGGKYEGGGEQGEREEKYVILTSPKVRL